MTVLLTRHLSSQLIDGKRPDPMIYDSDRLPRLSNETSMDSRHPRLSWLYSQAKVLTYRTISSRFKPPMSKTNFVLQLRCSNRYHGSVIWLSVSRPYLIRRKVSRKAKIPPNVAHLLSVTFFAVNPCSSSWYYIHLWTWQEVEEECSRESFKVFCPVTCIPRMFPRLFAILTHPFHEVRH